MLSQTRQEQVWPHPGPQPPPPGGALPRPSGRGRPFPQAPWQLSSGLRGARATPGLGNPLERLPSTLVQQTFNGCFQVYAPPPPGVPVRCQAQEGGWGGWTWEEGPEREGRGSHTAPLRAVLAHGSDQARECRGLPRATQLGTTPAQGGPHPGAATPRPSPSGQQPPCPRGPGLQPQVSRPQVPQARCACAHR